MFTTVPKERQSLSAATAAPLAAMPSLAARAMFAPGRTPRYRPPELLRSDAELARARAIFAPALSAASAMAERNGVFRRAEAPASAAEAVFTGGGRH